MDLDFKTYFSDLPKRTMKNKKTLGGPINIIIIGIEELIYKSFISSGWRIADKLTTASKIRIVLASIFGFSYPKAPVSTLYYMNNPQYITYELQCEDNPRKRHHVRFWRILEHKSNKEIWAGAASFDSSIEFSFTAWEFTHEIDPNVDSERDTIISIFKKNGFGLTIVDNFQNEPCGINGEGDYYYTDEKLAVLHSHTINSL